MRIARKKDGTFRVSSSTPGKYYDVDLGKGTCTCPHYRIRLSRIGAMCKHLITVQEKYSKKLISSRDKEAILNKVKKEGSYDIVWLMEEYSEDAVNALIESGDIIEQDGMVRIVG